MGERPGRTVPHKQENADRWAARLRKMRQLGISYADMAEMSGVGLTTVKGIAAGDRCFLQDRTAIMLDNAVPRFELAVMLKRRTGEFLEAAGA
ncbi:helix-turn-helix transcriptional regulator [Eggerthellaceae bacterium 24-137]